MRTETDLLTGDKTYTLAVDALSIAMLGGAAPGEVRLFCSPDGVARAVEAVAHPPAAAVRAHAEELAAAAEWELPARELLAIPDQGRVMVKIVLASVGFTGRKVASSEEALNLVRQALQHGTWRVADLEVEVEA